MEVREQCERAAALDSSYLFIQGPPGTGKTWTGARIVVDLVRRGRRVGVAATSHKAIHNLLDEIERAARAEGVSLRGLKKCTGGAAESEYAGDWVTNVADTAKLVAAAPRAQLVAGTAWLFAHRALDGGELVDTLVIDEAGQVSLADALAMGTAARNVILLGDPLQLAQVSQGTHPEGTGLSVLEHLLGTHATVPAEQGHLPRSHAPDAPGRLRVRLRDRLRQPAGGYSRCRPADDGLRHRACATCRWTTPATRWRLRKKLVASPTRSAPCWMARGPTATAGHRGSLSRTSWWSRRTTPRFASFARRSRPPAWAACRWAPWTSSRAGRRRWSSTRWRPRVPTTSPAASTSSSRATASTSPSPARCAWPASSPAPACWNHAPARSSRCGLINALCRFVEMAEAQARG